MRQKFTNVWNTLSPNIQSILISLGALVISVSLISIGKIVFPKADFTQLEVIVTTAFSGFVAHIIKENVRTDR